MNNNITSGYEQNSFDIHPRNEGTSNIPGVVGNQNWGSTFQGATGEGPFGGYNNSGSSLGSWFGRFGSGAYSNPFSGGYGVGGYGNSGYPYSSSYGYGPSYNNTIGNMGYGNMFGSSWGNNGNWFPGMNMPAFNNPIMQNIVAPGQSMLSSLQHAMQVFARFSGMMEEIMRNLHLVFDSIFGLVQILGVLKQEIFRFVAPKSSLFQPVLRVIEKLMRFWKLFLLFIMSPLAGRFSPVTLALKVLGLAPEDAMNKQHALSVQNMENVRENASRVEPIRDDNRTSDRNDDQESNL
eukprot:jgi/Galph1/3509/GphlegSOOS_G2172.1